MLCELKKGCNKKQKKYVFARNGSKWGTRLGAKSAVNGTAMARHGLILGEHEATACTDLLEALLAQYRPILDRFWTNMLDLPGTGETALAPGLMYQGAGLTRRGQGR